MAGPLYSGNVVRLVAEVAHVAPEHPDRAGSKDGWIVNLKTLYYVIIMH